VAIQSDLIPNSRDVARLVAVRRAVRRGANSPSFSSRNEERAKRRIDSPTAPINPLESDTNLTTPSQIDRWIGWVSPVACASVPRRRRRRNVRRSGTSAHLLDKSFSNDGQTNYFSGRALLTRFRAPPFGPWFTYRVPSSAVRLRYTPLSDRSSDSYIFFPIETCIKV